MGNLGRRCGMLFLTEGWTWPNKYPGFYKSVDFVMFYLLPRQTPYMAKIAGQVSHLSNFKAWKLVLFNGWSPCRRGPGFGVHLDIGCEELPGIKNMVGVFLGGLPITGTYCILLIRDVSS